MEKKQKHKNKKTRRSKQKNDTITKPKQATRGKTKKGSKTFKIWQRLPKQDTSINAITLG